MRIAIEHSSTGGIYSRLSLVISRAIREYGHECILIDPAAISASNSLLESLESIDWVLIVSPTSVMNTAYASGCLFFEHVPAKIVFLHLDAIAGDNFDLSDIAQLLCAWGRVHKRSLHFTIEKRDARLLEQLGFRCHLTNHMQSVANSTTVKFDDLLIKRSVNFVGHVLPPVAKPEELGLRDQLIIDLCAQRLQDYSLNFETQIEKLFPIVSSDAFSVIKAVSQRIQLLNLLNLYTVYFRGAIFERLPSIPLDIFGGDPNPKRSPPRTIVRENVCYHPQEFQADAVSAIYRNSAVSLNITSLQFDSAVINRPLDVYASGGFCLTDRRCELSALTSVSEEISYSNLEELYEKSQYFLDPQNQDHRLALMAQVRSDFGKACSPNLVVGKMLCQMAAHK